MIEAGRSSMVASSFSSEKSALLGVRRDDHDSSRDDHAATSRGGGGALSWLGPFRRTPAVLVLAVVITSMLLASMVVGVGRGNHNLALQQQQDDEAFITSSPTITMTIRTDEKVMGRAPKIRCNDILLGAWIETCFLVADAPKNTSDEQLFPGRQGVMSYPIIITTQSSSSENEDGGGFDLHGYSVKEPFFDGNDYWEVGHGTPSRVDSPNSTTNCVAYFESKLKVGRDGEDWDDDAGDYYWNYIDTNRIFAGNGKGAACYFERVLSHKCQEVRTAAIAKFAEVNMTISLPSTEELCQM